MLLIHTVLFIPYGKFVPYGKYSVGVNLKTSKDKDMRLIFSNMQEMKNWTVLYSQVVYITLKFIILILPFDFIFSDLILLY